MQCPRCHFENMPGQSRCFKCGSVLDAKEAAVNVQPPRMAKWKKPFRLTVRRLRRLKKTNRSLRAGRGDITWGTSPPGAVSGLLLSIIPGLAHLAAGRFSRVRWYCLAWLILLVGAGYLFGSTWGFAMLGLAIGIHAWVAFNYSLNKNCTELSDKIGWLFAIIIALALLYWGVRRTVFADFIWAYTNLTIPSEKIETGDCLLARRTLADVNSIKNGSLVLVSVRTERNVGGRRQRDREVGRMIVQVIALPGQQVTITQDGFSVDGEWLDPNDYPFPQWLRKTRNPVTIAIPDGCYFVSSEYELRGAAPVETFIRDACVIRARDIQAQAIMVWFPVHRRRFLRIGQ